MIDLHVKKKLQGAEGTLNMEVQLTVASGEMLALYGASGAGKTTLLRYLAGLDAPDSGYIRVDGVTWFDSASGIQLPPQQRRAGLMFQDFALFPNMTVRDNIAFALPKGSQSASQQQRLDDLLAMIGLQGLQHRLPAMLSGGQKQRLALARALAAEPQLLLLDEPLSALDANTRQQLQVALKQLQQFSGLTTLLVSHDVGEVYKLAQRVCVLESGKISQSGTPLTVFAKGDTSGKFRFNGELLAKETADVMVALTVLVSNQIVRVLVMPEVAATLCIGDHVMLVSKAFNPMVFKLDQ